MKEHRASDANCSVDGQWQLTIVTVATVLTNIHINIFALAYGSLLACSLVITLGNCSTRPSFSTSPLLLFSSVSESDMLRSVLSETVDSLLGRRASSRVLLLTSRNFSLLSFRASIADALIYWKSRTRKAEQAGTLSLLPVPDTNWQQIDCMYCMRVDDCLLPVVGRLWALLSFESHSQQRSGNALALGSWLSALGSRL